MIYLIGKLFWFLAICLCTGVVLAWLGLDHRGLRIQRRRLSTLRSTREQMRKLLQRCQRNLHEETPP